MYFKNHLVVSGLPADFDDNVDVVFNAGLVDAVFGLGRRRSRELVQLLVVLQLGVAIDEERRMILIRKTTSVQTLKQRN